MDNEPKYFITSDVGISELTDLVDDLSLADLLSLSISCVEVLRSWQEQDPDIQGAAREKELGCINSFLRYLNNLQDLN